MVDRETSGSNPASTLSTRSLLWSGPRTKRSAIGASYQGDDFFSAVGPRLRAIKVMPRIDLQVSAQVEYLRYQPDLGEKQWNWTYGLRGDLGFSILSLYVGVGRGLVAREEVLGHGYVVSFGTAVGMPIQTIKKFFRRANSPWKGDGAVPGS